jgi:DNA modification methylase
LAIRSVPIDVIRSYERNPRKHPAAQIEKLKEAISQFGFVVPVLLDATGTLVAGHARVEAASQLGYVTIPAVDLAHLSPNEIKALRIADNRLAELASWDDITLAVEFKELMASDLKLDLTFDMTITGFSNAEIDRVVTMSEDAGSQERDDLVDAAPITSVSLRGDTWGLGEHRVVCGDSTLGQTYIDLLGTDVAAAGIHDFPYNVPINGHVSITNRHHEFMMAAGEMSPPQFQAFLATVLRATAQVSKPGAIQFSFMDWRHAADILAAGESSGLELKNLCVWDKGVGGMGSFYRSQHELIFVFKDPRAPHTNNVELGKYGRNRTNVWAYPGGAAAMKKELVLHSTPKPVALVADAIRDCTSRGDIVLDAFSGSGTTIIAAARTGRRARVIELDPRYVDVAVRRWETWSGGTAYHVGTGLTFEELRQQRQTDTQPISTATPNCRIRQRIRQI